MGWSQRVHDDRKRVVELPGLPSRIVSLVPSDTLNVAALGCAGALVGRTDYCELPADVVAAIPSVGGTKNPRIDDIVGLKPELVLANQEENTRSDLEALAQLGVRVYIAFPTRVIDGLGHLARLARLFGVERDPAVRHLLKRGYDEHRAAEQVRSKAPAVRSFCPIWMDPLMTIRGDTFISDMLDLCGASNVFADSFEALPPRGGPRARGAASPREGRRARRTLPQSHARRGGRSGAGARAPARRAAPVHGGRCGGVPRSGDSRGRAWRRPSDEREGPMLVRRPQHRGHRAHPCPRRAVHVVDRSVVQCPHFLAASGMASAQWGHGFVVTDGL